MAIQPPYLKRMSILPKQRDGNAFPFNTLPYLTDGFVLDLTSPITFLIGENGTGKSTLLEAIAVHAGFHAQRR